MPIYLWCGFFGSSRLERVRAVCMNQWLSMSPYTKPLLGLLAAVFAIFLVAFLIRQMFKMLKFFLMLALVAVALIFYLDYTGYFGASPLSVAEAAGEDDPESEAEQSTARQIFAQIVDNEDKDTFAERAILERRPFKHLLKAVSKMTSEQIRKASNDRTLLENLSDEPDQHRGEAYFAGRGVILEVFEADLGPEYGFPKGWTVLRAIFVNTAHEVFAQRILCAPGSTLFKRLDAGIKADQLPVLMVSGLFFKNYALKSGDEKEIWVKPLLICPEPETPSKPEEPRQALKELQEAGYMHLLPSKRLEAPYAAQATQERLVIDVTLGKNGGELSAWGVSGKNVRVPEFLKTALDKLKARLPAEESKNAAVVLNVSGGELTHDTVALLVKELKTLGVLRVGLKKAAISVNSGK